MSSVFLSFSFLGLVNAVFLTQEHYLKSTPVFCPTGGCDTVLSSVYSSIAGVPLALLGTLHYLVLFAIGILFWRKANDMLLHIIALDTALGAIFSVYLVFIQLFVIHAICFYCMISAGISFILLALGLTLLNRCRLTLETVSAD